MLQPLSERDIRLAACNALERRIEWLRDGRTERFDTVGVSGLGRDWLGCLGELAVAKWLGRYPGGFSVRGAGDLVGVEVRTIEKRGAALQVYREDPDCAAFVLAYAGDVLRDGVDLLGWIPGAEAKDGRFWDASHRAPAFLVPQMYLRPMAEWFGMSPEGKQCARNF
jgi:hypothetical protein